MMTVLRVLQSDTQPKEVESRKYPVVHWEQVEVFKQIWQFEGQGTQVPFSSIKALGQVERH